MRPAVWMTFLLLPVAVGACSKENAVEADAVTGEGVGAQCSGSDDRGCGVAAVCVMGFCRTGCTNDAECPQGTLCLGESPPYGCSLPSELSCKQTGQSCRPPLTCGIDGRCRFGCKKDADCPRNEHVCLADTCVSKSEPGSEETWFACIKGGPPVSTAVRCSHPDYQLQVCNTREPGWVTVEGCGCRDPKGAALPVPSGLCIRCSAVDPSVNCESLESNCAQDEPCYRCAVVKYTPDCEDVASYAALAQCGCQADGGVPPVSCDACIAVESGCPNPCEALDPQARDKCEMCMHMKDANCQDPDVKQALKCLCESKCGGSCEGICVGD
ncbi:MAG TPA: hypothetical protein PLI95_05900 [Polyangiaceae bacterium]|nr:hypothetical protein [Polyangiaceae bacterium]